jgi:hypothetical protein
LGFLFLLQLYYVVVAIAKEVGKIETVSWRRTHGGWLLLQRYVIMQVTYWGSEPNPTS